MGERERRKIKPITRGTRAQKLTAKEKENLKRERDEKSTKGKSYDNKAEKKKKIPGQKEKKRSRKEIY